MLTPDEVVRRLIGGGDDRGWESLPELYAEDAVVDHPMAPLANLALHGREEVRQHFAHAPVAGLRFGPENVVVHRTGDPEVIVAEFQYRGTNAAGRPFRVPAVFVLRIRNGLIVESRDYVDHLAFARARGDFEQLAAAIRAVDTA